MHRQAIFALVIARPTHAAEVATLRQLSCEAGRAYAKETWRRWTG